MATALLAGCTISRLEPLPPAEARRDGAPPVSPAPAPRRDSFARRAEPPAPQPGGQAGLAAQVQALGQRFDGRVGIAVEDVDTGWTTSWDGSSLYPQQGVSKLCTAIALFDAVDQGRVRLTDPVEVRRQDMSVFHQPLLAYVNNGPLMTTIGELAAGALVDSDNAADDILIARLGGQRVVQGAVDARSLRGVRCGPPIHILEARIAGLDWRPEYSFGNAFWAARDSVDPAVRAENLRAYLSDPEDGASPLAITRLLARLYRGELLSSASTDRVLSLMGRTRTGPQRLPAGLGPGWRIAHKTGTGQDLGDLSTGNNDVGLLMAPDGRVYAVAVMIASTHRPVPERQKLMAAVARAVVAAHDGQAPAAPTYASPVYNPAGYTAATYANQTYRAPAQSAPTYASPVYASPPNGASAAPTYGSPSARSPQSFPGATYNGQAAASNPAGYYDDQQYARPASTGGPAAPSFGNPPTRSPQSFSGASYNGQAAASNPAGYYDDQQYARPAATGAPAAPSYGNPPARSPQSFPGATYNGPAAGPGPAGYYDDQQYARPASTD